MLGEAFLCCVWSHVTLSLTPTAAVKSTQRKTRVARAEDSALVETHL